MLHEYSAINIGHQFLYTKSYDMWGVSNYEHGLECCMEWNSDSLITMFS